jgi:hypothetical protein
MGGATLIRTNSSPTGPHLSFTTLYIPFVLIALLGLIAIYERLANPPERPMTAFSFECGSGSENPSKAPLGFHS